MVVMRNKMPFFNLGSLKSEYKYVHALIQGARDLLADKKCTFLCHLFDFTNVMNCIIKACNHAKKYKRTWVWKVQKWDFLFDIEKKRLKHFAIISVSRFGIESVSLFVGSSWFSGICCWYSFINFRISPTAEILKRRGWTLWWPWKGTLYPLCKFLLTRWKVHVEFEVDFDSWRHQISTHGCIRFTVAFEFPVVDGCVMWVPTAIKVKACLIAEAYERSIEMKYWTVARCSTFALNCDQRF